MVRIRQIGLIVVGVPESLEGTVRSALRYSAEHLPHFVEMHRANLPVLLRSVL